MYHLHDVGMVMVWNHQISSRNGWPPSVNRLPVVKSKAPVIGVSPYTFVAPPIPRPSVTGFYVHLRFLHPHPKGGKLVGMLVVGCRLLLCVPCAVSPCVWGMANYSSFYLEEKKSDCVNSRKRNLRTQFHVCERKFHVKRNLRTQNELRTICEPPRLNTCEGVRG